MQNIVRYKMILQFKIHFKNRSFKMEELPSHMGGGGAIYKRRVRVGTYVDIFQILIEKVGGDLPWLVT